VLERVTHNARCEGEGERNGELRRRGDGGGGEKKWWRGKMKRNRLGSSV